MAEEQEIDTPLHYIKEISSDWTFGLEPRAHAMRPYQLNFNHLVKFQFNWGGAAKDNH